MTVGLVRPRAAWAVPAVAMALMGSGACARSDLTVEALSMYRFESPRSPAAGAAVALDLPDGTRVEGVTGSDGRVTFRDLKWEAGGTASVTTWLEGHAVYSRVGIDKDTAEVQAWLLQLDAPADWVDLGGTVTNMTSTLDWLTVSTTLPGKVSSAPGVAGWATTVPTGEPFTIIACERADTWDPATGVLDVSVLSWATMEHGAVTGDATENMDMAMAAVPETTSATLAFPARADSPLREARPRAYVTSMESWWAGYYGGIAGATRTADGGGADFVMDYLDLPGVTPVTVYGFWRDGGGGSEVVVMGWPMDGTVPAVLLDVPDVTVPADPNDPRPLHDPIAWENFEPEADAALVVWRDGRIVWLVEAPPGATTLTVPALPSGVDAAAVLGTSTLDASVALAEFDATRTYILRGSGSPLFELEP